MGFYNKIKNIFASEQKEVPRSPSFFLTGSTYNFNNFQQDAYTKEGYIQNAIVHMCVSRLAKAISSLCFTAYRRNNDNQLEPLERDHPLTKLLRRANVTQSFDMLIQNYVSDYLISGNAFLQADRGIGDTKFPQQLFVLPFQYMGVEKGKTMIPKAYVYEVEGNKTIYPVDPKTGISNVLQIKTYNPKDIFIGLSPLESAAWSVDIYNNAQRWNYSLLKNGARPSGALSTDGQLTPDQISTLKGVIDEQYSGAYNAGRPLLLEGGLTWTDISLSPRDLDYSESLKTQARNIAGIYNVPPQLINIPGEATYNTLAEARLAFWQQGVLPLADMLIEELSYWFSSFSSDEELVIKYDEDKISALEPARKDLYDRMQQADFMKISEKRMNAGLPKYESDSDDETDSIYLRNNMTPIELVGLTSASDDDSEKT